jgi:K+-sensing histidine kinase KdpD
MFPVAGKESPQPSTMGTGMRQSLLDKQKLMRVAPGGRANPASIAQVREKLLLETLLPTLLDAMPVYAMVLNEERQILAVNKRLLNAFGIGGPEALVGKRPGEALTCSFSTEGPDGCGTGHHCTTCGAVLAILESQQQNARAGKECRLALDDGAGSCLDLEVMATPIQLAGMRLIVFAMRDISAEKRRSVLETVFFHDVLNTAGGIRGLASALAEGSECAPGRESEYKQWMVDLSARLVDEITHQQKLLAAERGEFKPEWGIVPVADLVREVRNLYASHEIADGRELVLGPVADISIMSDGAILRRILGNLVKNALEATPAGGTVVISAIEEDGVTFAVNNPGVMPEEVQLQLFQRSFSTKESKGRGIGTYSIRLFGERYLKGKVEFRSREPEGTTFRFTVPRGY